MNRTVRYIYGRPCPDSDALLPQPHWCPLRTNLPDKLLVTAIVCTAMTACATTQPVPYSGIPSSSLLQPAPHDESGRIPYAYSGDVDWLAYSGTLVEPVAIYGDADAQFEKIDEQEKLDLARYMYTEFRTALNQRFPIAGQQGPGILRVRLTLTGAKPNKAVLSTFTKFDMAGLPYNTVQSLRGKEGLLSGSVSYAVEVSDSVTGEVLLAYVTKQYPNAMNVKASIGALSAARTGIRKGAGELLARMQ